MERSLRLLGTDYLDILLVHDPEDLSPVFEPGGALEVLRELKEQGVIRAIGLGVRRHEFHRRCMETGEFDVSLTFCDYNLIDQSAAEGVLKPAAAHDVGILNAAAVMRTRPSRSRIPTAWVRDAGESEARVRDLGLGSV